MSGIINFAHRGASGYCPENTMAAFSRALELGATGIETDVQMTQDGHLVLIHDETLLRTAGMPEWVKDLTLEQLKSYEAGSWFGQEFRGEHIPTLVQLLELVKDKDIVINIELKNGIVQYPGMEEKVIAQVREFGMTDRVIISSFNHYSLVTCKSIARDIRTGILYMEGLYEPWEYAARVKADALHAYKYALTPELVSEAKRHGVPYHPFTVNEVPEMRALIQAGVSGIITDYPDRLATLLSNHS